MCLFLTFFSEHVRRRNSRSEGSGDQGLGFGQRRESGRRINVSFSSTADISSDITVELTPVAVGTLLVVAVSESIPEVDQRSIFGVTAFGPSSWRGCSEKLKHSAEPK